MKIKPHKKRDRVGFFHSDPDATVEVITRPARVVFAGQEFIDVRAKVRRMPGRHQASGGLAPVKAVVKCLPISGPLTAV